MGQFNEKLGEAVIEIRAKTDKLKQDLSKATSRVKTASMKMAASFRKAGTALSIGLTAPLVLFGKQAVEAAAVSVPSGRCCFGWRSGFARPDALAA